MRYIQNIKGVIAGVELTDAGCILLPKLFGNIFLSKKICNWILLIIRFWKFCEIRPPILKMLTKIGWKFQKSDKNFQNRTRNFKNRTINFKNRTRIFKIGRHILQVCRQNSQHRKLSKFSKSDDRNFQKSTDGNLKNTRKD